jgi:hypothetical protein
MQKLEYEPHGPDKGYLAQRKAAGSADAPVHVNAVSILFVLLGIGLVALVGYGLVHNSAMLDSIFLHARAH